MQVQLENIPQYLKTNGQFCNWRLEDRGKIPYIPGTKIRASVNDPSTFRPFQVAATATGYDGIGIRVSDRIVGIDLDHCIVDGKLLPWAQEIVDQFHTTYIESSPSGTGIRIFCLLPDGFSYDAQTYYIKNGNVEVYIPGHTNRFLTVTGNALIDNDVMEMEDALIWLLDTHMRRPTPPDAVAAVSGESYLSDNEVITKASASKNGDKFRRLWHGDISGYKSQSEADAALLSILAFWCSGDKEQMDRLFRQSCLMRDKWDEYRGADTYLGHTVNFKTTRKSYKSKKKVNNDPTEWVIFENTHEAIIDQETFEIVQNIRNSRRRLTPMGEMPILSGMLFCADCGAKLYQVRARGWTHEQEHFVCATYRKQKGKCTSHSIRNVQVEQILLAEINRMLAFVRERESEFVELLTKKSEKDLNRQLRDSTRELEQAMQRISKLDGIIQRLYEDNLDGKISDERFSKMTATYEQEQKGLEARVSSLREIISRAKHQRLNIDSFLAQVKKYTEIKELDAEIIRTLVERIDVFTPEKIPGSRTKKQTVLIHWNFIGAVNLPQEQEKSA